MLLLNYPFITSISSYSSISEDGQAKWEVTYRTR